jgi:hypothetical protein
MHSINPRLKVVHASATIGPILITSDTDDDFAAVVDYNTPTEFMHGARFFVNLGCFCSRRYGARFGQKFALDDAIGSHACSREALACM